ncbi:MAG: SGNH/GDSL hydrolase family protein [Chloroflexi bacterium]|nr:SGNH/GDSL hydrolase family protein [Chloroflexota bacterium]
MAAVAALAAVLAVVILTSLSSSTSEQARVGPRPIYLALGDSLAYGIQPNFDISNGYGEALYAQLKGYGTRQYVNMACPGETSGSMLAGGCRLRSLAKSRGPGSQIDNAVAFIEANKGQVSPVTLTIGANDVTDDLGPSCAERAADFDAHLAQMERNLDQIVSRLQEALDGQGDLLVTTYYNPFAVSCPATDKYLTRLNDRIAAVVRRYDAGLVDISPVFAGRTCDYTWMCSRYRDIHATTTGYGVIADAVAGSLLGGKRPIGAAQDQSKR